MFQIRGVGLASRKSTSLERGKLRVGCLVMNGYFSASHFVQNENIFFLEVNVKKKKNPESFLLQLKINIFINSACSGKGKDLIGKGTQHLSSLKL